MIRGGTRRAPFSKKHRDFSEKVRRKKFVHNGKRLEIMRKFLQKAEAWLAAGNRWKHLAGGAAIGLFAGSLYTAIYAGAGIAAALELKDRLHGGRWDWTDFGCTIAGAVIGRLIFRWI